MMRNSCFDSTLSQFVSRRTALKLTGLGASSAILASALGSCNAGAASTQISSAESSQNSSTMAQAPSIPSGFITKEIPRTKERVPAIGLGTFLTFDVMSEQPRENIREVIRLFWEAGGRMIDVSPLYGLSEVNVGEFATALGVTDDLFITNKVWATGEYLGDRTQAEKQFEQSLQRLSRDRLDAMQVHSLVNVDVMVPLLKSWKQADRIRYVGVTHHDPMYFSPLASWIEKGDLDFVQVRYSIAQRQAEERILPAAIAQGTAVLANMPFEKARLFELVKEQPLPDFASEIDCENWAQFFLKYVISHPAVTAAIPATTNPNHVTENMGALRGSLPDSAMRSQMVKHMESIPGFDKLTQTAWYPGKQFTGQVRLSNPRPIG
jgi:diketogulonate reductase-like aldo/keto reductase